MRLNGTSRQNVDLTIMKYVHDEINIEKQILKVLLFTKKCIKRLDFIFT